MASTKLADMVEEEAARAEAESPDEDEDETEPDAPADDEEADDDEEPEPEAFAKPASVPEPEPEPEAFATIGPKEIKQAERAIDAQRKKLAAIFGDEAVAHDCLLCAGLGFLPDLPPAGTTFSIVLTDDGPALIAEEPMVEPAYSEAPDKEACPWCDGYGQALSGSKASFARLTPCGKCSGNGWVQKIMEAQPQPQLGIVPPLPVSPDYAAADGLGPDAWGRPHGHHHWGVPPASIPG